MIGETLRPVVFGVPWGVPACDPRHSDEAPTPVGEPCIWCEEAIVEGDRGFIRSVVGRAPDADWIEQRMYGLLQPDGSIEYAPWTRENFEKIGWRARQRPIHAECDLRMTLGSVAHVQRRCSCFGGDEGDPAGVTKREAALAVWRFYAMPEPA